MGDVWSSEYTDSTKFYQVHRLSTEKESGLVRSSKSLNEKLATVLLDLPIEGDPLAKHAQRSQQDTKGI